MYRQEIVISPDIFEKISRAFSDNTDIDIDLKSYKENLNLKKVLFDKDKNNKSVLLNEIKIILSKSSDFGRQKIDTILKMFQSGERCNYRDLKLMKVYSKDDLLNKILILAALSESKIINSEHIELNLLKNKYDELKKLEVLNFEDAIKPSGNSRNYCNNKKLIFKRGEQFIFEEYFEPYLYDTRKIIVTDKYLRKRNGGYLNMMRLINICKNLDSIEINTFLKDDSEIYKPDIKISEIETEVKRISNNITIRFRGTGKHRRTIETDDFLITLDPGFDFVNNEYIAEKHDAVLMFERKTE